MEKIRIVKTGSTQPFLTLSKVPKGVQLFTERNAVSIMSGDWKRELADLARINGQAPKNRTFLREILDGFSEGAKMRQMGEAPSYVLCTANEENQKISLRSHFPGDILILDIEETGPILTQRGAFLAAFMGVEMDLRVVEDVRVAKFAVTGEFLQYISPREKQHVGTLDVPMYCFLEVHGDVMEIPLYPGETVKAMPGTFLCMTEGVKLEVESVDDLQLRDFEDNSYLMKFTAPDDGTLEENEIAGKVWFHSMIPKELSKILEHK